MRTVTMSQWFYEDSCHGRSLSLRAATRVAVLITLKLYDFFRTAIMLQWAATKLQWVCDHIIVTVERVSLSWWLRYISHTHTLMH